MKWKQSLCAILLGAIAAIILFAPVLVAMWELTNAGTGLVEIVVAR